MAPRKLNTIKAKAVLIAGAGTSIGKDPARYCSSENVRFSPPRIMRWQWQVAEGITDDAQQLPIALGKAEKMGNRDAQSGISASASQPQLR